MLSESRVQFFLRGTQLAQLTEEYEVIRANTETMQESMAKKKDALPELKDAYRRAKARANEATAAINQQEKVKALRNELAWAYVAEVEDVRRLSLFR